MAKYIDAEKLKAEIKRRIEWLSPATTDFAEGRRAELRSLYDFIANLQQEQPEVDLEKEIDKVIADYSFTKTMDAGGFKITFLDYAKIARHFYELGRNAKEE